MKLEKGKYFNRELSWLSFNYRVLQEAQNDQVPLIERLRFLAIFSSNLDEFYRVRVASYRHLIKIQKKEGLEVNHRADRLVKKINKTVYKQQQEFGFIFREALIPALQKENIFIINDKEVTHEQQKFLIRYFKESILPYLKPKIIKRGSNTPFLENRGLYMAVTFNQDERDSELEYGLLNIPTDKTPRFIVLPDELNRHVVIQLSDVLRLFLHEIFAHQKILNTYAVKLTRDAELYLEEEIGDTVLGKIKASLHKRITGVPTRFLYDETMPKSLLKPLRKKLGLKKGDLVPGGRYHNFHDFFEFPYPENQKLVYPRFEALVHPDLKDYDSFFEAVSSKDFILHFPYQSYDHLVEFLEEAAVDPDVESIKITIYRVAEDSKICKALIRAAKNGKAVTVFNEVKARFDEKINIYWGGKMEHAGVKVLYSFPDLKVHSKICLIARRENKNLVSYACLSTGNFNEKTANIYCDHALLTKDSVITNELHKVFDLLSSPEFKPKFEHLLVAPFNMRQRFYELIDTEIANAKAGVKAKITLKMNSLQDSKMIDKLYEASNAGVKIKIIIRGLCTLVPGVENLSENIKVISIIDRYLEHGRIYIFHHGGEDLLYLASADWMTRNLSHRVEVGFPIKDKKLKKEILKLIKFQLKDNTKARKLNITQSNPYKKSLSKKPVRAQYDFYHYLKERAAHKL
jgi:polyphosphate kinase